MLLEKTWSFTGKTGKHYPFTVFSKSALLPENGGIYILAYAHPRGHLAGFQINTLTMGETDNLHLAVSTLQQDKYLVNECWNYTFILPLDAPEQRTSYFNDLIAANPPRCCH
ncbi:MAG: hypothetical protein AB7F61_07770 [Desulfobulbus sp.]